MLLHKDNYSSRYQISERETGIVLLALPENWRFHFSPVLACQEEIENLETSYMRCLLHVFECHAVQRSEESILCDIHFGRSVALNVTPEIIRGEPYVAPGKVESIEMSAGRAEERMVVVNRYPSGLQRFVHSLKTCAVVYYVLKRRRTEYHVVLGLFGQVADIHIVKCDAAGGQVHVHLVKLGSHCFPQTVEPRR